MRTFGWRLGLLCGLAAVTLGCSSSEVGDAGTSTTARVPLQVEHDDQTKRCTDGMDWLVFMDPGASADQIEGVGQALLPMTEIERLTYVDSDAAYDEFQTLFADDPDALAELSIDEVPTSFRVWSSSEHDPPTRLRELAGVRELIVCLPEEGQETATHCGTLGFTWAVFLHPEATEAEVDEVGRYLAEMKGLEDIEFLDQAGAYEEFKELFAHDPEMIDSVTPSELPPSFRVRSNTVTSLRWSSRASPEFGSSPSADEHLRTHHLPTARWISSRRGTPPSRRRDRHRPRSRGSRPNPGPATPPSPDWRVER